MATITIYLPKNQPAALKEGDDVKAGQVLAKSAPDAHVTYDLVNLLSIKPKDTPRVVSKKEGDHVVRGEVLAKKSGLFSGKTVIAAFDGTIATIDAKEGKFTLAPSQIPDSSILSPVGGIVKKVSDEGIALDFDGIIVFAKQGMGEMKKGILVTLGKEDEDVILGAIKSEHKDKVLLGGHFTKQLLEKAFGLGVASVLATEIDEGEFAYFEQKKFFNASICLLSKVDYDTVAKHESSHIIIEGKHKRVIIL